MGVAMSVQDLGDRYCAYLNLCNERRFDDFTNSWHPALSFRKPQSASTATSQASRRWSPDSATTGGTCNIY